MNEIFEKLMQLTELFFHNLIFKLINIANLLIIPILRNCVATNSNKMRKIILKLHKSSSSVGFIKKSLT